MSTERNDGGPAFPPHAKAFEYVGIETGMPLRDLFATKAMQGMVAFSGSAGLGFGPGDIAGRAYQIADAMLAEREKQ